MQGYKVVFTQIGQAEIQEFVVKEPKENEVVIKVLYTLISAGTEKAIFRGEVQTGCTFPRVPGYSSVGTIVKVGKNVTQFKEGDRVFAARGGHGSYNTRPISRVVKIPDEVRFEDAVFTRMASFPLLALRRSHIELGETAVIVGLGVLGLIGVQLAKIAGALPVIAVGNREIRRELARKSGADYVFEPNDPKLKEKIVKISSQYGNSGANVVIETSGSVDALISAINYTGKRGRIALNGCNWGIPEKPIDLYKIHLNGIELIGVHDSTRMPYNSAPGNWTAKKDFMTILGLMEKKRIDVSSLRSNIVSAEKAPEIYGRLLNDRQFPLGVIFDWSQYW